MTTTREAILQALFTRLQTISGVTVQRNEVFPEAIPNGGLIIVRDGDPGEPEVFISPVSYYWTHNAILEVAVQKATAAGRDAALDTIFQRISSSLSTSGNLGGLCERIVALAPDAETLQVEGKANIKAASVTIELVYSTTDQLG